MRIRVTHFDKRNIASVLAAVIAMSALTGCVTTQAQADGSTRVNVSVADMLGRNKSNETPAQAQVAATQPVRAATAMVTTTPKGIVLSNKSRAALVRMLECNAFVNGELPEGIELEKANAWSAEPVLLQQPVIVLGHPVSKFQITADGSAATYKSYFSGLDKQQFIKSNKMKLSKGDKNYHYRTGAAGEVAINHTAPEIVTECYIDTEGSYEDAAPVKKTKKKK